MGDQLLTDMPTLKHRKKIYADFMKDFSLKTTYIHNCVAGPNRTQGPINVLEMYNFPPWGPTTARG